MSESASKLLSSPYGEVAYDKFKLRNRAFVDKSGVIKALDSQDMTLYPVLLRPRRFGKSTFVQMIKCFYDISFRGRYRKLFSGTDIYREKLKSHNTYHVLDFDFSAISGRNVQELVSGFILALRSGIVNFKNRYPDFVFAPQEDEKKTPSAYIKSFINAYEEYPSKRLLYVMIDEYDNFANSILSSDLELFRTITASGGFLKDFYAALKEGAKNSIEKIFITGVSSVSLDSLTSGFNIALNVTSDACFNEYAGFTGDELKMIAPLLVDLNAVGTTAEEVVELMKPVYDGYCFSSETTKTVYNSSMCLYYLNMVRKKGQLLEPEKCLDPASDINSSKLGQLFGIAEDGVADAVIETYLGEGIFRLDSLAENINLNDKARYDRTQLLSMLYYLGYLTIDPAMSTASRLALKIPNLFMSRLFAKCVVDLRLKSSSVFGERTLDVSSMLARSDDISGFAASCTEFLSSIFTNQVLGHMSEMALNLALYAKLDSVKGIFAELQKSLRISGKGEKYADLAITVNEGNSSQCTYLIELKYMKKKDAKEATAAELEKLKNEARRQAAEYSAALEFRGRQVKAYAMIFSGSECLYCGH